MTVNRVRAAVSCALILLGSETLDLCASKRERSPPNLDLIK